MFLMFFLFYVFFILKNIYNTDLPPQKHRMNVHLWTYFFIR